MQVPWFLDLMELKLGAIYKAFLDQITKKFHVPRLFFSPCRNIKLVLEISIYEKT